MLVSAKEKKRVEKRGGAVWGHGNRVSRCGHLVARVGYPYPAFSASQASTGGAADVLPRVFAQGIYLTYEVIPLIT